MRKPGRENLSARGIGAQGNFHQSDKEEVAYAGRVVRELLSSSSSGHGGDKTLRALYREHERCGKAKVLPLIIRERSLALVIRA